MAPLGTRGGELSRPRPRLRRGAAAVSVLGLAAVLAAGCQRAADGGRDAAGEATRASQARAASIVVALGDQATAPVGPNVTVRDSWAQQLYREALARRTVFVNLATDLSTTAEAVERQAALLAGLRPRVVVMLLGLGDLAQGIPAERFGADLGRVLAAADSAGAAQVLVGTLPDEAGAVAAYNEQIRVEAAQAGAVVVDLAAATVNGGVSTRTHTYLPDSAGQAAIAAAFARAYRRAVRAA